MNERIDELMIQAGARFEFLHGVHYDNFQYKTFARLIIKECADLCDRFQARDVGMQPAECAAAIRLMFGVEE